ncbi:MAG: hypothetical protein ACM30I_18395 [Gemmatimonas sp.]
MMDLLLRAPDGVRLAVRKHPELSENPARLRPHRKRHVRKN